MPEPVRLGTLTTSLAEEIEYELLAWHDTVDLKTQRVTQQPIP
jgi:hypothetical protein